MFYVCYVYQKLILKNPVHHRNAQLKSVILWSDIKLEIKKDYLQQVFFKIVLSPAPDRDPVGHFGLCINEKVKYKCKYKRYVF